MSSQYPARASQRIVRTEGGFGRIPVTGVTPVLEGGAYPVKAVVHERILIQANVFREGHDAVNASVILTSPEGTQRRVDMKQVEPLGLDIWQAHVRIASEGDWTYRVEGWSDPWGTWRHHAEAKLPVGVDVELVCMEGRDLLQRSAQAADALRTPGAANLLRGAAESLTPETEVDELLELVTSAPINRAMARFGPRELISPTAEVPLRVERKRALYSSWYEFFPRSQGAWIDDEGRWHSGTFDSSHDRLEAAARMGFHVVYLPPIHPIGSAFRKGRNNTLTPGDQDPGSPWAIGSPDGGHDAIHPELGDFESFDRFIDKARSLGLEIALDLALQASPDHPWVTEHPEWFSTRMDGTIAYAENPPKKYQDIYPINFDNDPVGIYHEVLRIVRFWIERGVTVFRVDNPHTKPVEFWDWLIERVYESNPEVIFLAEAFTRPQMMGALGKVGFQQSYTYFTWRNTKQELTEYLTELSTEMAAYYRPNFFVNTPDINPFFLQSGNHAAFAIRAILAATMSPSWGVYSGFELFEHLPLAPGKEEYLDSEKFEFRPRNYDAQPNLNLLLGRLNEIREEHTALQQLRDVTFHHAANDAIIAFSKADGADVILTVCSLDPDNTQDCELTLDLAALGAAGRHEVRVTDQLTGESYLWSERAYVRLYPGQPAHILHVTAP
ncbi:alpha-1,4-glucan--maltose-1-phosphate maltosyltransferase [Tessaracoccus flavus]|uniref:Alpha-1,4-glucan:maltose-1-phosphate maltosyltransferase n=1 Tax=Tessaracoccus flavus TaxID=1610493 RepID=A0A1Q2CEF7_9ACTN|nr:alpha-1,4-glucan--maltose-1-phosphate maltosyltransferase [Tessaracoccus flavus]AQP44512.1 alpha-1,4-glucan--maltose-1-phosphate maltosyltransferase [Tessaracoccus flavus]SDY71742.1 starch synthase (maltosyl-transferring) [Tessaracoccus flavus]